ncbi:MAG: hypothetical protein HY756_09715 [Nitrospirae bacterium]|nr:hypothetical protein [Nitrospirota bacterium]
MSLKSTCPGSEEIRHPTPEDIRCHNCGKPVEIWSDEVEITCKHCGGTISRDRKPSCIDWCTFAKECVGEEKYNRLKKALK